jgi:hypothetical protein
MPRPPLYLCLGLLLLGAACNLIDTKPARHAEISHMVPGAAETDGGHFLCWLTLEFKGYPPNGDLRDVEVHFDSIALAEPAVFDWAYIAAHDKLTRRDGYGSGLHEAEVTSPGSRPPLGHPTKVRFPLPAKSFIEKAPEVLYLEAELYWGGRKQDSTRQTIEHLYSSARHRRR